MKKKNWLDFSVMFIQITGKMYQEFFQLELNFFQINSGDISNNINNTL